MEERNIRQGVSYSVLKLARRYMELDGCVHNYGTNVSIYHSEIHLVSAIARNPGIHVRGLAERMGVASASVSETVRKLEKKGLVRKEISPDNQSRLSLYLTKKGELAHEEHTRYHKILEHIVEDALSDASDAQVEFITTFFADLLKRMDGFEDMIQ